MDPISILIIAVIAVWFTTAVISMIKNKGGCSCGCGKSSSNNKSCNCGCSSCGSCNGCAQKDKCAKNKNKNK